MSAISGRSLSLSSRVYRSLLRAYPAAFLAEFEDLLCQAFGDLAHRAVRTKGHWGLFVLWMRTIPDLISSVLSQRFQPNSDWRFRLRWISGCTGGAVLGVGFMFVVRLALDKIQMSMGTLVIPRSNQSMNYLILQFTASFGLALGWFQSLAIGWKGSRRAAWTISTMLGAAATAGIVLLIPIIDTYLRVTIHPWRLLVDHHRYLYSGGFLLLSISVMGFLQAMVSGRRNVRFLGWIPVSAIAVVACGFVTAFTFQQFLHRPDIHIVRDTSILGLIVGAVYGLLTVIPMEWILQPRAAKDAVTDQSSELPS